MPFVVALLSSVLLLAAEPDCPPSRKTAASSFTEIQSVLSALQGEGFVCAKYSRVSGLTCLGRVASYPRSVAVIVPPGFRPDTKTEAVLYLHGNNPHGESLETIVRNYGLAAGFARSKRNAVMIVPHSLGATEDFEQNLAHAEGFGVFMNEIGEAIRKAGLAESTEIGPLTLAAHSGGYRAAAAIVRHQALPVQELYLMDASYGRHEDFAAFAALPGRRFWGVNSKNLTKEAGELAKLAR